MKNILWLDLETYCEIPIKNGTHAYAEGVEVMLFAWAIDDGPVNVHDFTESKILPAQLLTALGDECVLIYAHNSHFDRTMLRHELLRREWPGLLGAVAIERWRDTMVKALAHGLRPSRIQPDSDLSPSVELSHPTGNGTGNL